MPLARFVTTLVQNGRVAVPPFGPLPHDGAEEAAVALAAFEATYRTDLPGEPPAFDPAVGAWAARVFFHVCQFVVYRDVPPDVIADALRVPPPRTGTAAVHYSADAVLRFLPDAAGLARAAAENDPLADHLRRLGGDWPLSSVGMAGVTAGDLRPVLGHPCLRAVYADRVIARRDVGRLANAAARAGVRRALGLHPHLVPDLAAALAGYDTDEATR